jgi:hypothetical protein
VPFIFDGEKYEYNQNGTGAADAVDTTQVPIIANLSTTSYVLYQMVFIPPYCVHMDINSVNVATGSDLYQRRRDHTYGKLLMGNVDAGGTKASTYCQNSTVTIRNSAASAVYTSGFYVRY